MSPLFHISAAQVCRGIALGCLALAAVAATHSWSDGNGAARAVAPLGPEFDGVDVKNKLGEKIDTNIPFTDATGKAVTLAEYLDGAGGNDASPKGKPVIFTLNFYRCTSICSAQLNALVSSLARSGWAPGPEKFRIVTVSFDPSDTVEIAAGKQKTYREELVRQLSQANGDNLSEVEIRTQAESIDWTFLVAREKSIRAILDNVGYSVKYDERTEQYAHTPVTYVLTPAGLIGRYLWGIDISPRDLKFSLMESSDGELGSFGEKILLSCFDYNRDHGGYEAFAWGFMRIGGISVMLIFGAWLIMYWRREKRRSAADAASAAAKTLASGLSARPSSPSESRP